jgi:hypothetical protein
MVGIARAATYHTYPSRRQKDSGEGGAVEKADDLPHNHKPLPANIPPIPRQTPKTPALAEQRAQRRIIGWRDDLLT